MRQKKNVFLHIVDHNWYSGLKIHENKIKYASDGSVYVLALISKEIFIL
jgi:hypothetical protein